MTAYNKWCENKDIDIIEQTVNTALGHWKSIAEQMLALHQQNAEHCSVRIEALVNNNHI
jgi:hypothetical protein